VTRFLPALRRPSRYTVDNVEAVHPGGGPLGTSEFIENIGSIRGIAAYAMTELIFVWIAPQLSYRRKG
jgi:hypothetical protein